LVEDEMTSAIVLCDRGSLDGLAYWPDSEEAFWKEIGTTKKAELSRYAAVIHLRTPTVELGYNHENPVRIETAYQAAEIDSRIAEVWKDHPNRFFVQSENDFLVKTLLAINLIRNEIPECCRVNQKDL
jgi:hypothetical protein